MRAILHHVQNDLHGLYAHFLTISGKTMAQVQRAGHSLVAIAIDFGHLGMVKELIRLGSGRDEYHRVNRCVAVMSRGYWLRLSFLFDSDLPEKIGNGLNRTRLWPTAITWACCGGELGTIRFLIDKGVDVDLILYWHSESPWSSIHASILFFLLTGPSKLLKALLCLFLVTIPDTNSTKTRRRRWRNCMI